MFLLIFYLNCNKKLGPTVNNITDYILKGKYQLRLGGVKGCLGNRF